MYIQGRWNKGVQGAQVPPPQVLAEMEAKTLPCHPIFYILTLFALVSVRLWNFKDGGS